MEQIIVLHLYKNQQVTLQGIGTFCLNPFAALPEDMDKQPALSKQSISFTYNATATEDDSLVDSIVHYTKKLKPLASSDLESFLHWQKQLLNINMGFKLEDVGMLQKTSTGQLAFIPYESPSSKTDVRYPVKPKKEVGKSRQYNTLNIEYGKKLLTIILLVIGLSVSAWLVYEYKFTTKPYGKISEQKKGFYISANNISEEKKNTSGSIQPFRTNHISDVTATYAFKIVFLQTKIKSEALKTLNNISGFGHSPIMYFADSVYKIAMPFNRPLNDTLFVRDSLNKYYSLGKGFIEVGY